MIRLWCVVRSKTMKVASVLSCTVQLIDIGSAGYTVKRRTRLYRNELNLIPVSRPIRCVEFFFARFIRLPGLAAGGSTWSHSSVHLRRHESVISLRFCFEQNEARTSFHRLHGPRACLHATLSHFHTEGGSTSGVG